MMHRLLCTHCFLTPLLFAVLPGPALASAPPFPTCLAPPDSVLAERFLRTYAPTLQFAPGERYFPTLPFFAAFDHVDNDGSGSVDDPRELAPTTTASGTAHLAFDTLLAWYDRDIEALPAPPLPVVIARVCYLDRPHRERLRNILKSDKQAWKRVLGGDNNFPAQGSGFYVIQYFMYYLGDTGLEAHAHDTEKLFVFVPEDSLERHHFLLVVGAGHSPLTPNNILVLSGATTRLADSLHAIVELGGHAVAPDLPPYGYFQTGRDVNWFLRSDVWGTRDLQAVGGIGYTGAHTLEYALPRNTTDAITLAPWIAADSSTHISPRQYAIVHWPTLIAALLPRGADSPGQCGTNGTTRLTTELGYPPPALAGCPPPVDFAGVAGLPGALGRNSVKSFSERMLDTTVALAFRTDLPGDQDASTPPLQVLKSYLYPGNGLLFSLDYLFQVSDIGTRAMGLSLQLGLGSALPAISGISIPGTIWLTVRVPIAFDFTKPVVQSGGLGAGLRYDSKYLSRFSWFAATEVLPIRRWRQPGHANAAFLSEFGLSTYPFTPKDRRSTLSMVAGTLRLTVGLQASWQEDATLLLAGARPYLGIGSASHFCALLKHC